MAVLYVLPIAYAGVGSGTTPFVMNFTTTAPLINGCLVMGIGTSISQGFTIVVDGTGTVATSILSNGGLLRGYALLLGSSLSVGAHTVNVSWTTGTLVQAGGWIFSGVDQTGPVETTSVIGTLGNTYAQNPAPTGGLSITSAAGDMTCSIARTPATSSLAPDSPAVAIWGGLQGVVRAQGSMPASADTVPGTGTTSYSWTNSAANCRVSGFNIVQAAGGATDTPESPVVGAATLAGITAGRVYGTVLIPATP